MKLRNKVKSQKGAMDRIIVTLILVIISVAGIVGIEKWFSGKKDNVMLKTNEIIVNVNTN